MCSMYPHLHHVHRVEQTIAFCRLPLHGSTDPSSRTEP
jgi:hypothetical protein